MERSLQLYSDGRLYELVGDQAIKFQKQQQLDANGIVGLETTKRLC